MASGRGGGWVIMGLELLQVGQLGESAKACKVGAVGTVRPEER